MSSRPPPTRGRNPVPVDASSRRSRSRSRRPSVGGATRRDLSSGPSTRQPYLPSAGRDSSSSYGQASYSTTGSQEFVAANAPFNVPVPNPSYDINDGYNNVEFRGRNDPQYNNSGPPYDPSQNTLSTRHENLVNYVEAAGYGELAGRFCRSLSTF
jgi:hypothetical protein